MQWASINIDRSLIESRKIATMYQFFIIWSRVKVIHISIYFIHRYQRAIACPHVWTWCHAVKSQRVSAHIFAHASPRPYVFYHRLNYHPRLFIPFWMAPKKNALNVLYCESSRGVDGTWVSLINISLCISNDIYYILPYKHYPENEYHSFIDSIQHLLFQSRRLIKVLKFNCNWLTELPIHPNSWRILFLT